MRGPQLVCMLALLTAMLTSRSAEAEVSRSVQVLVPGLPLVLGTADIWHAPDGSDGALLVLPQAASAPNGFAAALVAQGHDVIAFSPRRGPAAQRAEHDAMALGQLPARAGRAGDSPVLIVDGEQLPRMLRALAVTPAPSIRAVIVDARVRLRLPAPPEFAPEAQLPPLITVLDENRGAAQPEALRLQLAWRARGGDAQQASAGSTSVELAALVDDYLRSRAARRVPRFESLVYAADGTAESAVAALAPDAARVVGLASTSAGAWIGLDGPRARVLRSEGDRWRLDADFGRTALLEFGAARGSDPTGPLYAVTADGAGLLVRRLDAVADVWRPVAVIPVDGRVGRAELHAASENELVAAVTTGIGLRAYRLAQGRDPVELMLPPGRADAFAAGRGTVMAVSTFEQSQVLWFDARGKWREIARWPVVGSAKIDAVSSLPVGGWLLHAENGSSRRIDPLAGSALELDAAGTLGTLAISVPSSARPVVLAHPETGDRVLARPAGWALDGYALLLWRESAARYALAAVPGVQIIDALGEVMDRSSIAPAVRVAGRDSNGKIRILTGRLRGVLPPVGWWQADEAVVGGLWLAHGADYSELHRLDVGSDGGSRWRLARAVMRDTAMRAVEPWRDPFDPPPPVSIATRASPMRLDFGTTLVRRTCGVARAGEVAAVLVDGEPKCLRTGRAPGLRPRSSPRGLWQQPVAESPARVGLSDAGISSGASDLLVMLLRDGDGRSRWRLGFADPLDGSGIAAVSEWRETIGGRSLDPRIPRGLLTYRSSEACGDGPLNVEWRPFTDAARLPGLPNGLAARFPRADLPVCY